MDFLEDLRQYVSLRRRQRELDSRLSSVKEEADRLQGTLLDRFAEESIERMSIDGETVYLHRQLWATAKDGADRAAICDALQAVGLDHFVYSTYNSNTLSAHVRELEAAGEALPPELEERIDKREVFTLRVRKS